jgi:diadenosine tetraphosphate (Ap4A) HIT family hydrolase
MIETDSVQVAPNRYVEPNCRWAVGGWQDRGVDGPESCYACRTSRASSLPVREEIYRSSDWRVAHAFDTSLPGWLVVLPTWHVSSLSELESSAAEELGRLLRALSTALERQLGATKSYVMLFAEAEGFEHLHVHVAPRMPDQPVSERGPKIFARLGGPDQLSADERDRVSALVRDELARVLHQSGGATPP